MIGAVLAFAWLFLKWAAFGVLALGVLLAVVVLGFVVFAHFRPFDEHRSH